MTGIRCSNCDDLIELIDDGVNEFKIWVHPATESSECDNGETEAEW
jgi:hypothetical protein